MPSSSFAFGALSHRLGRAASIVLMTTLAGCAASVGVSVDTLDGRGAPEISAAQIDMIDDLISRMTLKEKVGQMMQITLSAISSQNASSTQPHILNEDEARRVIVEYGAGSILNNADVAFDDDYWREIVGKLQAMATEETRLGVPLIYGIDSVHGANYINGATLFPHNLTLAATWNPELARVAGEVTAAETRASGLSWNFAPVCDVIRMPAWSRVFETFGEDPMLAGIMASATIEGMQGDDLSSPRSVAATAKHFLGYAAPRTGRDRTPAYISDASLRDTHLAPFQMAFDSGVRTIMVNSSEINGTPVHADGRILRDLLRDELGYDGVVVTDWADIQKLYDYHMVAQNEREATKMAVLAGIDIAMTPLTTSFADVLVSLVEDGEVPESRINESVRRILALKAELGLFESQIPAAQDRIPLGDAASQQASLDAAREGITLLRNNGGVLPLAPGSRVLVAGPGADSKIALHGSWSYNWQGTDAALYPESATILDALRTKLGAGSVEYAMGSGFDEPGDVDAAVRAAADCDVVVLCLGETPSVEKPGDFSSLMMSSGQADLAKRLAATGKPVVLAMVTNRPRVLSEFEADMDAILWLGHAGPHGGTAFAEILTGEVNPSGRLAFSYPSHPNALLTYDHKRSERIGPDSYSPNGYNPLFAFGDGIGYSPFAYEGLTVSRSGAGATVSVRVSNQGSRTGSEVVQVYVGDLVATLSPRVKRLKAFNKIELAPGASRTVTFELGRDAFEMFDRDGNRTFEPGAFEISVGDQMETLTID